MLKTLLFYKSLQLGESNVEVIFVVKELSNMHK